MQTHFAFYFFFIKDNLTQAFVLLMVTTHHLKNYRCQALAQLLVWMLFNILMIYFYNTYFLTVLHTFHLLSSLLMYFDHEKVKNILSYYQNYMSKLSKSIA